MTGFISAALIFAGIALVIGPVIVIAMFNERIEQEEGDE